ncbi:DUF1223 domain-containing protein [Citreimonas salinaria]|uniref:DUF1223 domain-containing protein n=1 Tax=Citreimonas salinaria TaxID=321339 RepID=A0A1H3G225_9RHOB|nr:DUF1223 domain-containing protein [Citreimonas salinaria]SDX97311.1 hypothetical protein SAMN05444340_102110 [Citreimonas salinaria]
MRTPFAAIFVLCLGVSLLPPAARAQQDPVVVELFTSQGCASCPPADANLARLAEQHDEVIALALHVDYWDYIGWPDRFAQSAFTKRQKGYARAGGWKTIYTPQVVVDGQHHAVGSAPDQVAALVARHAATPAPVELEIAREGGTLAIRASAAAGPVGPVDVHVVRYADSVEMEISSGENAGKRLTYTHIVEEWDVAARWDGTGAFDASVPVAGPSGVVVLVQKADYGPILAAVRLR